MSASQATRFTPDEAAHLIAGRQLAALAWREWSRNKVEPTLAIVAIMYLVEEALDRFPELRDSMRAGLQAAIDQERAP